MLNELSLFSGYGGFSLGLRLAGMETRTVGYVEIDKYCQQIIQARIRDGFLDDAPIFPDISTFNGARCRGVVDIITAGFPCQPHSVAGQQRGEADDRNLWPDTLRVIRDVGPRFVLLENVPGILANGYAGTAVGQLSEAGYDCLWGCVSAASVGAPHRRERWWLLAYARHSEQPRRDEATNRKQSSESLLEWATCSFSPSCGSAVADAAGSRCKAWQPDGMGANSRNVRPPTCVGWWSTEPDVGRVVDGVAHRVDRLRALGNGIVPLQLAYFLRKLA